MLIMPTDIDFIVVYLSRKLRRGGGGRNVHVEAIDEVGREGCTCVHVHVLCESY